MNDRLHLRVAATAYAACYAVGAFLPTLPEGAYSDEKVSALLADSGQRTSTLVAGHAFSLAGLGFLVFVALLAAALPPGRQVLARVALGGATAYAAMLMLASVLATSLPVGISLGELSADTDPSIFRVLSNGAFHALLVPGLLAAAVVLVAVSLGLRGVAGAPRWCWTLGLGIAPLLLLGVAWVPQFLVPVWALALAWGAPLPVASRPARDVVPV